MEQNWQICEIEDNSHSFTEYSVAAVPEIWIVQLEDGSVICYWPKVNPGKKIRKFCHPNNGAKWSTYKCRLLKDGEKFSSYEKAREAEKDSENLSMILDSSEITEVEGSQKGGRHDCNSSMDFEVSDDDGENEMIVGSDTADFNRANRLGRWYGSTKMDFMVENIGDPYNSDVSESDVSSQNNSKSSETDGESDGSEYYAQFKSKMNACLTSTILDEPTSLKIDGNSKVLAKIKLLETNISSFAKDMTKELQGLKQLFNCTEKSNDGVPNSEKFFLQSDESIVNSKALCMNNLTFNVSGLYPSRDSSDDAITQSEECRTAFSNERITPQCDLLNFGSSKVEILNVEILNEPASNVQVPSNTKIWSNADVSKETQEEIPFNVTRNEVRNDEVFLEKSAEMLKFPVSSVPGYNRNEDLMDATDTEEVMEKALIEHLLPLEDEDDVKYMNRAILMVFTEKFFVDSVTLRREKDPDRLYIKGTNTLRCWRESFDTKFAKDVKDVKKDNFISHFRRFKSAKRAALKSKENSKAKRKKLH